MADQIQCGSSNTCDCCSGITVETPQPVFNRPGLSAIAYRVGTQQQFKDTLLARLNSSHQLALSSLRTRGDDDFTIALLDAFSVMGDVLTFYTERIANEAYLRTATERLSVRELAELIGYQLRPGVAASAFLAFTIEETAAAFGTALVAPTISQVIPQQAPTVTIPVGTQIQSIPGPGQTPQTYETIEQIDARGDWNAITPLLSEAQQVLTTATSLLLSGSQTTLKKGDTVLLIDPSGSQGVQRIFSVTVNSGSRTLQTAGTDLSTTEVDFVQVNGSPQYNGVPPASALPPGAVADVPANTPLTTEAVNTYILAKAWDAATLLALAQMQNWDVNQLSTTINQTVSQQNNSQGQAMVFRQSANPFGFNAPLWGSLPFLLRYQTKNDQGTLISPPFPNSWENLTLQHGQVSHTQKSIFLDKTYSEIVPGSWILLHAHFPRAKDHNLSAKVISNTEVAHADFTLSGKVSLLVIDMATPLDGFPIRNTTIYCQSEVLPLAQVPITDNVSGNQVTLEEAYLGLQVGRTVVISGERSDLEGVTVAEVHTLDEVTLEGGLTVIKLDSSLTYSYSRDTVNTNANVAASTHGATVQEIMGSGDGTQTFQSFVLKQSPLTYVSASTPSGTQSTLQVRVNNLLWEEVPFFYGHGPDEHIYLTRQDDSGNTTVTFGDGQTGSRLPTGQQNVTAQYRQGIGLGGLVNANQLSIMAKRPLGVRGATNPQSSNGAADPEQIDDARQNATLTIVALDRVVSLDDYQNFARAFAGIAKAFATFTWSGEQQVVLLTVAGVNGLPVSPGTAVYQNLLAAIAASSEPFVPLQLSSYDPVFFRIAGTVTVDAVHLVSDVSANVQAALRATFSFDQRDFGQPVHRSEVIATIQAVDGVEFVDLTAFYPSGSGVSLQTDIAAAVPRPGKNEFFAAQLLTLDPAPLDGLEVTQ